MRPYLYLIILASMPFFWPLANGQKKATNHDNHIYTDLWARYAVDDALNPLDIKIIVNNGEVLLHGEVVNELAKERASEIAKQLEHIEIIKNYLHIDQSAYGTNPISEGDSHQLTKAATIEARLMINRHLLGSNLDISTVGRTAFLEGTVNSKEAYEAAEKIARDTANIGVVVNKLKIKPSPNSYEDLIYTKIQSLMYQTDQPLLEERIAHTLALSERVNAAQLKIDIKDGTVIIEGEVPSDFQKNHATVAIIDIVGVDHVQNNLKTSS